MVQAHESRRFKALFVGASAVGEGAGLLRFFALPEGALTLRAPGIAKQQSKLAPLIKPADELLLQTTRGRGAPLLTGVEVEREHPRWRSELDLLALYWFMAECAYIGAADEADNELSYRLIVNLLRSDPQPAEYPATLAVFCLKLLAIHGILPDLRHCALSGERLGELETAHVMPGGQGLVGLAEYNRRYARSEGLLRLDPERRSRWLRLIAAPLLDYAAQGVDKTDAAMLLQMTVLAFSDIAAREIGAARFLRDQWRLET
jgi:DNA repair protein RecO